MAKEFKIPDLGENVSSGTVVNVLVAEGDSVKKDQPVVEVETDKAVVEIPINFGGTVKSVKVKEGDKIKVGQTILVLEAGEDGAEAEEKPAPKKEAGSKPAKEKPAEEEAPRPARQESRPPRLQVIERDRKEPEKKDEEDLPVAQRGGKRVVLASPTVRRLAREMDVNLEDVPTADPSGRLTAEDIRRFASGAEEPAPSKRESQAAPAATAPAPPTKGIPGSAEEGEDRWGPVASEPMSSIRKATAKRMAENWATIPHVTHQEKADVTSMDVLKARYGREIEAAGGKFTVTAVLIKLAAMALKRFPKFNASVDMENETIVYKQYYHVGVAVDTPHGLLVPKIRDADRKSIKEICIEMPELAKKARDRKLSLEDMQGGTFTISNLGGLGGYSFTPIINAPEVAILGVSRSMVEPVYVNGTLQPRTMVPLSLSYDHRIIDGADAARFLRWYAEALEQPWMLFMED
ncbi:MAG: 2-oxo acid dehydrogenase subunit E2 [Candidatus Hydrogenedentes bacterium]|nr:2-oxo acid dehydrogenase subunit E2 [Candidatus Hydrogenedentota bacterium]